MKNKKAAKPTKAIMKPVTNTSHVQLSAVAFSELLSSICNNMHNNEGKSLPTYTIIAADATQLVSTSNLVRPVDDLRMLVRALQAILGSIYESQAPEIYKDRGPRVERLDQK